MTDGEWGLAGVVVLFTFVFVWCYLEDKYTRRRQRKYDERMAKYDTWRQINRGV